MRRGRGYPHENRSRWSFRSRIRIGLQEKSERSGIYSAEKRAGGVQVVDRAKAQRGRVEVMQGTPVGAGGLIGTCMICTK